jgi:hypothetical protein
LSGIVLSLCDFSGAWSNPYRRAGYRVVRVDIQHPPGEHWTLEGGWTVGHDVTTYEPRWEPDIVLAAPPCTCFCRPGARWWKRQDERGETECNVNVFRACLRLCRLAKRYWALENPPGRHQRLMPELGPPAWQFHPWEFGDAWHKQTYIWGTAVRPFATNIVTVPPARRTPNGRKQGRIAFMSSSWANERAKTPAGFAQAFFDANENGHPTH